MKNTIAESTSAQCPQARESGVYPSVTYGFNAGMAHMYHNPIELELRSIMEAEQAAHDVDALILEFRSLLIA